MLLHLSTYLMYNVYQHWDPLQVCVVGQTYPPEFYSWITNSRVRNLFERIAIETEEDFQRIINKLKEFNVEVVRPLVPDNAFIGGRYMPPPQTPRDFMIMIGDRFYESYSWNFQQAYFDVKDPAWPTCDTFEHFLDLPQHIQDECNQRHHFLEYQKFYSSYDHIYQHIRNQGNTVLSHDYDARYLNGAMITRMGKDLYFGTYPETDRMLLSQDMGEKFSDYRRYIVSTQGHSDGTYCPVCPGLIISLYDVPSYAESFPDWEVVYLPGQSWASVKPFLDLKTTNRGKWWIPGFEYDQDVINTVETWLTHWVGYVEETVFDVNMLIIDPKNVLVFNYNKQVFDALDRYGITAHVVPFRHRYFWDGGIHCVTTDIHRHGVQQDFFPERT
jgi:hypothetical protein